jgi:glycerol uptake facilitator-like aquaporin
MTTHILVVCTHNSARSVLALVILRAPAGRVAALVAAYIGAAYWFTASTSFANPALTLGRMLGDSFAGIAPAAVPAFVAVQLAGALLGLGLHRALGPAAEARRPAAATARERLPMRADAA